jgi:hypothetical protein
MKIRSDLRYYCMEKGEVGLKKCAMAQRCVGTHLCHGTLLIYFSLE